MSTDLIMFILRKGSWLINYLDDDIGFSLTNLANSQFMSLINILQ